MKHYTEIKKLFCLSFLLLVFKVGGNAAGFERLDNESGLSNSRISSIFQDRRLNVWIATDNGLNRYNGNRVVAYRHSEQDVHSLLQNMCSVIFETGSGMLLIGTENGIQQYDFEKDHFVTIPMLDLNGDTVKGSIFSISESPDGTVYVSAYQDGVFRTAGGVFQRIPQFELPGETRTIYFDRTGRMWLTDRNGNVFLDGNCLCRLPGVNSICESGSGTLYLSTNWNGCFRYDGISGQIVPVQGTEFKICAIRPAPGDGLFICTDGDGLLVYDGPDGNVRPADICIYDYDFFKSKVMDAFVDEYGNTWVAVYWKGIEICPADSSDFGYIGHRSATMNSIGTNCVTAICDGSGDSMLWVGTDQSGLYSLSIESGKSAHYSSDVIKGMPRTIRSLLQDGSGNLWIGSQFGGLFMFDARSNVVRSLADLTGQGHSIPAIMDIVQDEPGNIWAASNGKGIFRLSNSNGQWQLDSPVTVSNGYTCSLSVLERWLLVGTANGLELYCLDHDSVAASERFLDKTTIYDMCQSPYGTVWASTNDGIFEIGLDDSSPVLLKRVSSDQGLSELQLYSLSFDANDCIWAGTDNGIFCVDVYSDTVSVAHFNQSDGLHNTEFSTRAILRFGDRLVMGGTNGIVFFNPGLVRNQDYSHQASPVLRICDVYMDGQSLSVGQKVSETVVMESSCMEDGVLRLPHSMRSFSLVLSGMNPCTDDFEYSYRIDGNSWARMPRGQNCIHFDNLPFGRHRMEFSSNAHDSMCRLTVLCMRPWYWSVMAIAVYFLVLVVLGIFLAVAKRQRAKDEAAKQSLKKEVERVRNIRRTEELDVDSPDDAFMKRVMKCINENISNPDLNVEMIAQQVGVSRVHLYRRLKDITDMAPLDFLKTVRIREAARLLKEKNYDITQVSVAVGFKHLSTFSSTFKFQYGVSPSDYCNNRTNR